ncbi:MAG: hypothetical protein WCR46_08270, partial [Deltaproteobacteria bacterium]
RYHKKEFFLKFTKAGLKRLSKAKRISGKGDGQRASLLAVCCLSSSKINLGAMGFGRKRMTPDDRICRYYYNPKHSTTPFRGDK